MRHSPPDDSMVLDTEFLARAVALSRQQMLSRAGGPFGAIIVRDGVVIAEGWNEVTTTNDPTAHAEMVAIRRACWSAGDFSLRGASIYSSCEPCPMCLAAIYWARLDRLVFANSRLQAAAIGFDDAAIYDEIGLPLPRRSIPTVHLASEDAAAVFHQWTQLQNRTTY